MLYHGNCNTYLLQPHSSQNILTSRLPPSNGISNFGQGRNYFGRNRNRNREVVPIQEIPKIIVDAFLAAEDSGFYGHEGVDYGGIFRALLVNLKAGKIVQGGSTITQQVAKSLLLSRERDLSRKIKDFLLAQRIEERFTKEEILHLYLNQVYLGGGYYGIKSAFKGYFEKELSEATIAEAAMVAGLLVAPGKYSPYVNPEKARMRQDYVLRRLSETGKITIEQYEEARQERTKFRMRKKADFLAGHFTDWIRQRVIEEVGNERFLRDGLRIQTTLDYGLQKIAEKAVVDGLRAIDKRQGFKGPLEKIEDMDKMRDRYIAERTNIYREQSTYFTIKNDFNRQYEIEYDPMEYEKIDAYNSNFRKALGSKKFIPGYYPKDRILKYLKKDQLYKAIVIKTSDREKMIYVSLMGLTGIIPFEEFKWAKKRNISKERMTFHQINYPSKILARGDVVFIKIKELSTKLWPHISSAQRSKYAKLPTPKKRRIKKQRYLLCSLEQNADVEGALLALQPRTGEIMAMVGGPASKNPNLTALFRPEDSPDRPLSPFYLQRPWKTDLLLPRLSLIPPRP